MIVDLPKTNTQEISRKLITLRNEVGAMALGRVLTLLLMVDDEGAEEAIEAASDASRQHPCRIIVLVDADRRGANRLDAQIRLGGDAGASEVVVLRLHGPLSGHGPSVVMPLLLPDSPIVAWWAGKAPKDLRTDPIGRLAQRRITDAAACGNGTREIRLRAKHYWPGDTDLSWTRITRWRGLLAASLDQAPYEPITAAIVAGAPDSPSTDLLAAWLAVRLKCPVKRVKTPVGSGISGVRLERASGDSVATLSQTGQPDRRIALPRRELPECLADELRRLDPDDPYEDALRHGLGKLAAVRETAAEAIRRGMIRSPEDATRLANRLAREAAGGAAAAMIDELSPAPADGAGVKAATALKLAGVKSPRERTVAKKVAARRAAATRPAAAASRATAAAKKATASEAPAKTSPTKAAASKAAAGKPRATKVTASKVTAAKATAAKATVKRAAATTSAAAGKTTVKKATPPKSAPQKAAAKRPAARQAK